MVEHEKLVIDVVTSFHQVLHVLLNPLTQIQGVGRDILQGIKRRVFLHPEEVGPLLRNTRTGKRLRVEALRVTPVGMLLPVLTETSVDSTLLQEQESALHPLSSDVVARNRAFVQGAPKWLVQLLRRIEHFHHPGSPSVQGIKGGRSRGDTKDIGNS